jgi:hypothetical protein
LTRANYDQTSTQRLHNPVLVRRPLLHYLLRIKKPAGPESDG